MRFKRSLSIGLCVVPMAFGVGYAMPQVMHYQGYLTDGGGSPITTATAVEFRIWDAESGGIELWMESQSVTPDVNGLFDVILGSVTPIPVSAFASADAYLGVKVASDPELTPRTRIGFVPYALIASRMDGDIVTEPNLIRLDAYQPSPTPPIPNAPPPGAPQVIIADDVFNQLFVSMAEAGKLTTACVGCGTGGTDRSVVLVPDGMLFIHGNDSARITSEAGSIDMTPGMSSEGLSLGGFVSFTNDKVIAIKSGSQTFEDALEPGDYLGLTNKSVKVTASTGNVSELRGDGLVLATSGGTDTSLTVEPLGIRIGDLGLTTALVQPEFNVAGFNQIIAEAELTRVVSGGVRVEADDGLVTRSALFDARGLTFTDPSLPGTPVRLSAEGLDLGGNALDLSGSGLTVGGNLDVGGALTVAGGGSFTSSGALTFTGAGPGTLSLDDGGLSTSYGDVTVSDPAADLQSVVTASGLTVTSSVALDIVTLSESAGAGTLTLRGATSTSVGVDDRGLVIDDGATTPLALGRGGSGGFISLAEGSGGGRLELTADDIALISGAGDIRADGGTVTIEPSGGGPGGRVTFSSESVTLNDDVGTATATFHRTSGATFLAGGSTAIYRSDGVQLTGPGLDRLNLRSRGLTLTRPSLNDVLVCDLDATDLVRIDLDDDASTDIRFTIDPTPRLALSSGTLLRCEGGAELSTCDVSGAATYAAGVTVSSTGSLTCDGPASLSTCDVSGAATYAAGVTVSSTGSLTCDGPATLSSCDVSGSASFGNPVEIGGPSGIPPGSLLHVNGDITATGAKLFVEDHPADPTREIAYIALEGPEAGTYVRGSSKLKDGVAQVDLPEHFAMVSAEDGLTAQITPRNRVWSMLYVEQVTPSTLVVRASNPQDAEASFDFMVHGVRKGYENHQVVRSKNGFAQK